MMKIYTNESNASKEIVTSPKESVINQLLNFSKALEVHELKSGDKRQKNKVELILN